ncbi:MAG: ribosome biogenesis GTPase Der, partial [Verrucomicrobiota bacterium]|nr:ribosome biogenesis GTPase Der [Verrucomicrobiota bacterium]
MTSDQKTKARVVAIVGRPNVGKSAVFNRIAGKRIAIVHDESGVTRDRLMREVEWDDQRFSLVDTGGVVALDAEGRKNTIEVGIRAQVDAALGDAAAVILVADVQQGVHPLDEEVAKIVRKSGLPCVVAVNKCDQPQHEAGAEEFARLAFPFFPVAAQHNRGMGDLMDAVLPLLPEAVNETAVKPLRVAVVGRPNAGKSSYINRLLRADRVIVSEVAGTTRDSIDVPFTIGSGAQARHYTLVDTAGMRNRHRVDSAVERFSLFRAEESVEDADVVVLVLDPELGPTVQDKHIAALIQKNKKGCVLLMNKWDIAEEKGMTQTKTEPVLRQVMPFMNYVPLVFISAKTGYNIRKSIEVIDAVAAQTRAQLPTGMLNRTLVEATRRVVAPARNGKRLRVYYAVQLRSAPVTVRMFVNDPKLATRAYTEFMTRTLRERFGLEGAPVDILYRARSRPEPGTRPHKPGGPAGRPPALDGDGEDIFFDDLPEGL